jgi:hypothetical protein
MGSLYCRIAQALADALEQEAHDVVHTAPAVPLRANRMHWLTIIMTCSLRTVRAVQLFLIRTPSGLEEHAYVNLWRLVESDEPACALPSNAREPAAGLRQR